MCALQCCFIHLLTVRSKVKMGFFAKTFGRFAFLLSCLRLSRSRGTSTTPPTQDEEAETVPTVEVAPPSESLPGTEEVMEQFGHWIRLSQVQQLLWKCQWNEFRLQPEQLRYHQAGGPHVA